MRLGPLRHTLRIEKKTQTQDQTTGAIIVSWSEFAVVSGSIEALSAREFIAAKSAQAEISARIKIRYINGIESSMRIIHLETGDVYVMEGPPLPDPQSGRHWLTLVVSLGVKDA